METKRKTPRYRKFSRLPKYRKMAVYDCYCVAYGLTISGSDIADMEISISAAAGCAAAALGAHDAKQGASNHYKDTLRPVQAIFDHLDRLGL